MILTPCHCKHSPHRHLCPGVEDLMHLLYTLDVATSYEVLKKIGISMEGKHYYWNGKLVRVTRHETLLDGRQRWVSNERDIVGQWT